MGILQMCGIASIYFFILFLGCPGPDAGTGFSKTKPFEYVEIYRPT